MTKQRFFRSSPRILRSNIWTAIVLGILLLFSGCSVVQPVPVTPTPDLDATIYWMVDDAAMKIATRLSYELDERWNAYSGSITETAAVQETKAPTVAVTSIPSGLRTSEAVAMRTMFPCVDELKFEADITVPDKTVVQAGKPFTKTWKIRNNGTCTWDESYSLAFSEGDAMTDRLEISLPSGTVVKPDDTIELSVYMTAPDKKGSYAGFWMMKNGNSGLFGAGTNQDKAIWVKVEVQ